MTVPTSSATPVPVRIDFVSDVSCPWCVIGLKSLEQALDKLDGTVQAEIHFQPFELNANMPAEGEDIGEHIARKYGSSPEQMAQLREAIRARGEQLGFTFAMDKRGRIYNTFDAHRLLHWSAQALLDATQRTSPLVRDSAAAGYSGRAGRRSRVAALCVVCKSGGVTVDRSAPN